ncbi:MAG: DUF1800 family protein [Pseudomonadota bacterium]
MPPAPPSPPPPPPPPVSGADGVPFATASSTSRFLTQTTFGPDPSDVTSLVGSSASEWYLAELAKPQSSTSFYLDGFLQGGFSNTDDRTILRSIPTFTFWKNAISGDDQLRQRMSFALSQIFVVSDFANNAISEIPQAITNHQEVLSAHAFGNYRDLLEAITYEPAMGWYLTFMGNQKADPVTGRVPDENYARELLQLFTTGLVQLNSDGSPVLSSDGVPIELYTNRDITGLAKIFTGLDLEGIDRTLYPTIDEIINQGTGLDDNFLRPMAPHESLHAEDRKEFLNCSVPAGTTIEQSIDLALDCIMAHPNVGPFVGRQLIQRFTTSDPSPEYVARVSAVFDAGRYRLPNGANVGTGRKGDLAATLAAIVFDPEAREDTNLTNTRFGKIREPILRFTHWARAFQVAAENPEYVSRLWETQELSALGQHPFRAPSVFNFYRPGYLAPGTESGAVGMTVPELQIVNAASTTGYLNFIADWAYNWRVEAASELEERAFLVEAGLVVDDAILAGAFVAAYTEELALANDPTALVDHLDQLLVYGSMSEATKTAIIDTIAMVPFDDPNDRDAQNERVSLAIWLVMASPDYLVQR